MAKITHSHLNVFKVSTFLCYGCVSLSECGLPSVHFLKTKVPDAPDHSVSDQLSLSVE